MLGNRYRPFMLYSACGWQRTALSCLLGEPQRCRQQRELHEERTLRNPRKGTMGQQAAIGRGAVKPFEGFLGIRLQGLHPDATYTITGKEETFTGRYLMDVGIPWPVSGSCRSQIIRIDKI